MIGRFRGWLRRWLGVVSVEELIDTVSEEVSECLGVERDLRVRVKKAEADVRLLSEEVKALRDRLDAPGPDTWASFVAIDGSESMVGLQLRGEYATRQVAEARLVTLVGPASVGSAIVRVRSIFDRATLIVPPDSEIEREPIGDDS